MKITQIEL